MKMESNLAEAIQEWADTHHVSFTAAIHVLCSLALGDQDSSDPKEIRR